MRVTLDLNIPQHVYDEIVEIAEETDRTIEEVVSQRISLRRRKPPTFARHPEHDKMQREVDYFDSHLAELWAQYPNQYVAIKDQQVVDFDDKQSTLFRRIDYSYPNEIVMVRKVTGQPEREIRLRSWYIVD